MGPTHRHALESLLRLISVLNASARSSCSPLVRTRRTRIACPTLPLSFSQRSRLISRRWRRPRREPSLLPSSKLQTFERTVKIRRKSVLGQMKQITTIDPRVKVQKSQKERLKSPFSFLTLRTDISSSNLDVFFGFLCVSTIVP